MAFPWFRQLVTVTGDVTTSSGDCIENGEFVVTGDAGEPEPLAMTNRTIKSGTGPDAGGLLVKVWGLVTSTADYPDGRFLIDDGSGVPIIVDTVDRPDTYALYTADVDFTLRLKGSAYSSSPYTVYRRGMDYRNFDTTRLQTSGRSIPACPLR